MWPILALNPGWVWIRDTQHMWNEDTHSLTPQEAGVGVNNAGGVMGAHIVSSQDESRVKETIKPEGKIKGKLKFIICYFKMFK